MYSGYETLVKELAERLVKSGNEVTVYCHRKLFNEKPKKVNGVHLVYTPSVNSKVFSQLYNSFFSFIHVCFSKNDVVLVVNSANGPFGLLTKIFRKKTCINVDGLEWQRPKWKGLGSLYFRFASKLATLFFDEIITDSIEMNKIYRQKFFIDSCVIAYGSTMISKPKTNFLKNLNLNKNEYYLIVGRLIPDNNSKIIIDSFCQTKSNKKLLIVGDVPYKDKYALEIKSIRSSNIVFSGYINSQKILSELYLNCYGYIHGHEFGGTNPTMINALDLNCQILALDTIFNREMLSGKEVVFFKKNSSSIINAIKKFENSYEKTLLLNKNYRIDQKYTWSKVTEKYERLFLELKNGF